MIILGVLFGGLLYLFFRDECSLNQKCLDYDHLVFPKFTPELFFLYLLPPIILEAAYCLHNEHFFDNIRSILVFAVVGTVINFVLTGGILILVKVNIFIILILVKVNIFITISSIKTRQFKVSLLRGGCFVANCWVPE